MSDDSKLNSDHQWIIYGDLMRIYACIAVVILHTSAWVLYFQQKNAWEILSFSSLLSSACRWSVPVFIMLSGAIFLSSSKKEPTKIFLTRRLQRVGIPLLFWTIIYFIYIHAAKPIPFNLGKDLHAFYRGQPYYHLYFLFVIIGLYMITPALKSIISILSDKKRLYFGITILVITSIAVMVNKYFALKTSNAFTFFIPFIGYYLAGFYLKDLRLKAPALALTWLTFIISAIIAAYEYELLARIPAIKDPRAFDIFYVYCNPAVMIMSLCAYLMIGNGLLSRGIIGQNNSPSGKAFRTIARATFGVYLIHPIILEYSCVFYYRTFHQPLPQPMEIPFLASAVLLISFLIISGWIRLPYLKSLIS